MKRHSTYLLLLSSILLLGCASTTIIQSNPSGAKLYLNGESVGATPYKYKDTKIVGSRTTVKLEKEGYEPFDTHFSRSEKIDVRAIIGGIFVDFPFLWIMKYKPTHTYDLIPDSGIEQTTKNTLGQSNLGATKSKAERLVELKKLLDQKALTQDEYEKEKKAILEEYEK